DAGGVADLGGEPAHHAREPADRTIVAVADQQISGGEYALLTVEGGDPLTFGRVADAEPTGERGEVVRVVRLGEFEHHVVAHVDHVVDRAHPGGGQPTRHPVGRGGDGDPRDDRRREPTTTRPIDDVDAHGAVVAGGRQWRRGRAELHAELGGAVTGDAHIAPAVGPVPGDVGVEQPVRT